MLRNELRGFWDFLVGPSRKALSIKATAHAIEAIVYYNLLACDVLEHEVVRLDRRTRTFTYMGLFEVANPDWKYSKVTIAMELSYDSDWDVKAHSHILTLENGTVCIVASDTLTC